MNPPLVCALPGNAALAGGLAGALGAELGGLEVRQFPDGETYLRYHTALAGRAVVLACTLDRPDDKVLALLYAAATARDLGAARVGLVCPYLAYLRQDRRFRDGEAVTSVHFAKLLSGALDFLVTVDPHLHRHASLDAVYTIPTRVVPAAPLIAHWLTREVPDALLIGPDAESAQWVSRIAAQAGVPYRVLEKQRLGDRSVRVSVPDLRGLEDRTPVLVDDIVSTGATLIAALAQLRDLGARPPQCVAVHALFAGTAHADLLAAGAARVVTTNTVPHPSNALDVHAALAGAVAGLLAP